MHLTQQTRRTLLIGAGLSALTLAAFWPVTGAQFIGCDDPFYITLNAHVLKGLTWENVGWAFSTVFYDYYHPLSWLSHMLDVQLFGLRAGGHHLTSLLFHVANTLLLFGLLKRMTGAVWRSAFVAALFALHPLHVESVAWVTERKDVMSGFFFMLTLWAYARYAEGRRKNAECRMQNEETGDTQHATRNTLHAPRFYVLALVFFACGLMSKPMLVTLPFVLLLLDYWPLRRFQLKTQNSTLKTLPSLHPSIPPPLRLLLEKLPFLALSAGICVVTIRAQASVGIVPSLAAMPLGLRVSDALVGYATYLSHAFWPAGLAIFYPLPGALPLETVAAAGALLLGVTAWVVWSGVGRAVPSAPRAPEDVPNVQVLATGHGALGTARPTCLSARPHLLVGWFWFLGMLVPVIGLVQSGAQGMADRYTYLPLVGLFLMVVWETAERLGGSGPGRAALIVAGSAVLLACAALTFRQAGYWQDTQHLFQHALDVTQNNYMAHNDLAGDLLNRGKLDEAIEHYQASLAIEPGQGHALEIHCVLADAMIKRGRFAEAAEQLETVLSAHPEDEPALVQLGIARARQGKPDEAVRAFAEALRLQPNDAAAHNSFGNALAQQGKHEEAVRQFEEAVRLKPEHAGAHNNLAISLSKLGRAGEAISQYREAIRWQPDFVAALNNLAWMLAAQPEAKLRNGAEAVELATRACELTRYRNPVALTTLAAAYGEAGKFPEAISLAEQAQALIGGGNSAAAGRLRAMIEAFRAGQPYHGE